MSASVSGCTGSDRCAQTGHMSDRECTLHIACGSTQLKTHWTCTRSIMGTLHVACIALSVLDEYEHVSAGLYGPLAVNTADRCGGGRLRPVRRGALMVSGVSVGGVRGCTNVNGGGIHARAHARQRRSRSDGQSVTTALSAKPGLPFRVSCFVRDARIYAQSRPPFLVRLITTRGTARPPTRREDHEAARASESSPSLLFTAVAPAPPHGVDHARSIYFRQLGAAARRCLLTCASLSPCGLPPCGLLL